MARYTLSVAGETLDGVWIDRSLSYNKPAKNVETIKVPGRNGDLVVDYGTFDNVVITYPCYIRGDFEATFSALINKLATLKGYQKIQCSDDDTHYRMGYPLTQIAPTVKRIGEDGYFDLSFNCKPQRFLVSGDTMKLITTATSTMENSTLQDARPLIRASGNGTFAIGDTTVTVSVTDLYIWIDCETMEIYNADRENRGSNVSFSGNDFPVLKPGENVITKGAVDNLIIKPRWWEL